MTDAAERHAIVADLVKARDPDRYFASLFLKEEKRAEVLALLAFAVEVAGVRERISGPATGELRLQWWTDALENQGHGDVSRNPVAAALFEVLSKYGLPRVPLLRLVAARRFDLYDDPMPDIASFEGYAGETSSVLYQYGALILNDGQPVEPGDAAGHIGVAHALIGHMRAFGIHAGEGRIMLPWDIFAAHGVEETSIFSGEPTEALLAALGGLREIAGGHLVAAREAIAALPKELRPAFSLYPVLQKQLGLLARDAQTPFDPRSRVADWRKLLAMYWWAARG